MAKTACQPSAFEDALSEDSTCFAGSPEPSNSSISGTAYREDEADYGLSVKEPSTIIENACPPPSFASFYSEFLRNEAMLCKEIAKQTSSATVRRKPPSKPVAQIAFLADVIKSFQRLEFQIELQRYLLDIQACQCNPTCTESVMYKLVTGRDDLELSVYHEIMHKHGFKQQIDPFTGKIPVWEFIAPFSDDADISKCLSDIDELLALPSDSTLDEVTSWGLAEQ